MDKLKILIYTDSKYEYLAAGLTAMVKDSAKKYSIDPKADIDLIQDGYHVLPYTATQGVEKLKEILKKEIEYGIE
jgi:NADH dehydrogenase FAD-containing subunit